MEKKTVYTETLARIQKVLAEFDNVYVSFSWGKDSWVLLELTLELAKKYYPGRKIWVFHIDYEAQYQMTTDYTDRIFEKYKDQIELFRICLPIAAWCSTSMYQSYRTPRNYDQKEIRVRPMPENGINEENQNFDFFVKGMRDYDFQDKFGLRYHKYKGAEKTACLVGIRTSESLDRWRAIHGDKRVTFYNDIKWSKKMGDGVYNFYPIYDWRTEDIWTAYGKFGRDYNKLYDLLYQAGIPIHAMRVSSPFHEQAIDSLKLYKVIDPNNRAKLVGRVDGVNFSSIYWGTTAMGWKSIKLPPGHTRESYMYFLLSTLPEETRQNYLNKLAVSIKFWREKGGVLSSEVIQKLKDHGVNVEVGEHTNYKTDKKPVRMDYLDDIDIAEFKEIPTYKRMCVCIMKNDHLCKYMWFSLTKNEMQKRQEMIDKYNNIF